jgi:hypothetical protein
MGESQVANRWRGQGEVRAWREAVLDLLKTKFASSVTEETVQTIEQQTDAALLKRWHSIAASKETFEEFAKELR